MRTSLVFFALILSIFVSSGCTTVSEQDLADLQSPNAIMKKEAIDRISRGPGFPYNLTGFLVSKDNEKKAVAIMVELLQSKKGSKDVKLSILKALGEIGKRIEVPAAPLIEELKDEDPHVRHCAIEALGKTKNKTALPALVKLLEQQTDKYPVIWALGEIEDQRAIVHLDQLLDSKDKYVTYNAYRALAKIGTSEENLVGNSVAAANSEVFQSPRSQSIRHPIKNVPVHHPVNSTDRPDSSKFLVANIDQGALKSQRAQATKQQITQAPSSPKKEKQKTQEPQQVSTTKPRPEEGTALYRQAVALQRKGSLQEAKKLYEDALAASPNLVSALNNIGVIYMKEKNYGAARRALDKAVKMDANYVDPYYNLACLYALQNNVGRSLSYLKKAVFINEAARRWAQTDGDLDNLRWHSEYKRIVKEKKPLA
jgi:tetratricopeptide (TPR) repeat protein